MEKKTDMRIIKTEAAIKNALKEMVCKEDRQDITVKELAERAQIHRKTFYLHYDCMEALYKAIILEIAEGYFTEVEKLPANASFTEINRVFFTFFSKQEPFVDKIICSPKYSEISDLLITAMLEHNRNRFNPYKKFSASEQNIINTFLALGSFNIYRQWVRDGKKIPLKKLIDLTGKLMTNGVSEIV